MRKLITVLLLVVASNAFAHTDWIDSHDYASLNLADNAAVATGKALHCTTAHTISSATVLSSYFVADKGCMLTKSGSGTLTFNGGLEGGDFQFLSGWSSGLSGAQIQRINPQWFGAVPGGGNAYEAIQAALTFASKIVSAGIEIEWEKFGPVVCDLNGNKYGLSSTIYVPGGVHLKNGSLVAYGTAWTETNPMVSMSGVWNSAVIDIEIDGGWKCAGLLVNVARNSFVDRTRIQRFKTYGLKTIGNVQESHFSNLTIKQYVWDDAGWNVTANKDAKGLWVNANDSIYSNIVTAYSAVPLYVTGSANLFTNIHAYNGSADSADDIVLKIESTGTPPNGNLFSNCYWDGGKVQVVGSFENSFSNNFFLNAPSSLNSKALEFVATIEDEQAYGLSVTDSIFKGTWTDGTLVYSTSGSGTWGTNNNRLIWSGNRTADGQAVGDYLFQFSSLFRGVDGIYTFGNKFGNEFVAIDGGEESQRYLQFKSGGELRWASGADNYAESGSNSGSNYAIHSYNDDGGYSATPLTISRATGAVKIKDLILSPATNNREMSFELTSNTLLTIKVKGSDGIVRSTVLTLQ